MDTAGAASQPPPRATNRRTAENRQRARCAPPQPPSWRELIGGFTPLILAPAFYGPPAIFLVGPWLLLVLSLAGPFLLLVTFVLLAGSLLTLAGALLAFGYAVLRLLRQLAGQAHGLPRGASAAIARIFFRRAQVGRPALAAHAIATKSSSQRRLTSGAS